MLIALSIPQSNQLEKKSCPACWLTKGGGAQISTAIRVLVAIIARERVAVGKVQSCDLMSASEETQNPKLLCSLCVYVPAGTAQGHSHLDLNSRKGEFPVTPVLPI